MLPKEDRRAMLLRLFNEDPPLINITQKRAATVAETATPETPAVVVASEQDVPATAPAEAEEAAIEQENVALGQDEQEQAEVRETYNKAGDEEDRFNTTV